MVDMRPTNQKLRVRAVEMICDISGVEKEIAEAALARANADIKLAVLIALGADPEQGAALLEASHGNLRTALEKIGA
jgi:N-acetylmuramic acid 6-phosphate etherase